jgi:hypothetical protein
LQPASDDIALRAHRGVLHDGTGVAPGVHHSHDVARASRGVGTGDAQAPTCDLPSIRFVQIRRLPRTVYQSILQERRLHIYQ